MLVVAEETTNTDGPEIAPGVVSRRDGLEIEGDLSFNQWRRLGEQLETTLDRALWSLADWRLYGLRYKMNYAHGVTRLDDVGRGSVRVSKAFPPERRRGLSFEMHKLLAGLPPAEQEHWLNEVERQGWSRTDLYRALAEARAEARQRREETRPPRP